MHRNKKLRLIKKIFYKNFNENFWFNIIKNYTDKKKTVLEIGSGSGRGKQNKKFIKCKKLIGIDLDKRVLNNSYLDKSYVMNAYDIFDKFKKNKFDLIYSHMVAEHIQYGEKFISTQLSCLKSSGYIIHSTVSKYYYSSILNNFISENFKRILIKHLGAGRNPDDIFPAYYKLNCEKDIMKICHKYSLKVKFLRQDQPPGYLRRSFILMIIYTIIHKFLQYFFVQLRPIFIFVIKKK